MAHVIDRGALSLFCYAPLFRQIWAKAVYRVLDYAVSFQYWSVGCTVQESSHSLSLRRRLESIVSRRGARLGNL